MVEQFHFTSPKLAEGPVWVVGGPSVDNETQNEETKTIRGIDGYFVHKISKQLAGGGIKTVGTVLRTFAEYQGFHIGYLENPGIVL